MREARAEDEREAAEVDQLATTALRKVYWPTDVALKRRAAIGPELRRLVAVTEGRVVGVVQYYGDGERLALLGLGVHPGFQRRGIAGALLKELENIGRQRGCTGLVLRTVRETGNVEIFERLGFVVESEGPTDLFQGAESAILSEVVMRKDLAKLPRQLTRRPSTEGLGET